MSTVCKQLYCTNQRYFWYLPALWHCNDNVYFIISNFRNLCLSQISFHSVKYFLKWSHCFLDYNSDNTSGSASLIVESFGTSWSHKKKAIWLLLFFTQCGSTMPDNWIKPVQIDIMWEITTQQKYWSDIQLYVMRAKFISKTHSILSLVRTSQWTFHALHPTSLTSKYTQNVKMIAFKYVFFMDLVKIGFLGID